MTHFINIGLLFSFLTLAASGLLAFFQPFSLNVTRVHIVFGFLTFILVGFHLFKKLNYFKKQAKNNAKAWAWTTLVWGACTYAALYNSFPVQQVMSQSYEAKHRKEIIRPAPVVAALLEEQQLMVSRQPKEGKDTALSVHLALNPETKGEPAIAIWAETKAGSMIETLYISPELAYSDLPTWSDQATPRHKILPVWRHRYTTLSGVDPEGKIDAASGATENHSFSLDTYLNVDADAYVIFCEINMPQDPNADWDDKKLGQPSVLYSAYVEHREGRKYQLLELTGHGGAADKSGQIHYDMSNITSAKQLIDIVLIYSRGVAK
jgi:hypothetical protein